MKATIGVKLNRSARPGSMPRKPAQFPIGVLLVDDHPMTRLGVRHAMEAEPGIRFLGDAEDPDSALALAESDSPDVAVIDIVYPHSTGFDLIKDLKIRCPSCRSIAYTAMDAPGYAEQCLRAGAAGYLSKSESVGDLLRAVKLVHQGGTYLSDRRAANMFSKFADSRHDEAVRAPIDRLSDGEFSVFHLIAQGKSNQDIAAALHRSVKTVETYRSRIKRKVGVTNATELAQLAVRQLRPEAAAAPRPPAPPPAASTGTRRPKILIVDDHAIIRSPLAKLMNYHGYDSEEAANGFEALKALEAGTIDAMVLDLMMPEMPGVVLLERMWANPRWRSIPVVVVTGMADPAAIRAVAAYTQHVLTKATFDPDELFARLATLVGTTALSSTILPPAI